MRKHTISYQITRVHFKCGLVCNREFAGKLGQLPMKRYHMKGKKKVSLFNHISEPDGQSSKSN